MRLQIFNVKDEREFDYDESPKTFNSLNKSKVIKEFKSVNGKITIKKVDKVFFVNFNFKCKLEVFSSLTFEPFIYNHKFNEDLQFTNDEKYCDDEIIFVDNDELNLDEIVYSLIITTLPIRLVKKGEKAPSGEHFRVLSEDEYLKEKSSQGNPFDKLKDLDL